MAHDNASSAGRSSGLLKERRTYEILRPEDVGRGGMELVLGKHSGRNAILDACKSAGIVLQPSEIEPYLALFKALADKKHRIFAEDLYVILWTLRDEPKDKVWRLENFPRLSEDNGTYRATITLRGPDNETHTAGGSGDGTLDAIFSAVQKIVGLEGFEVISHATRSASRGQEAVSEARVEVNYRRCRHQGVSRHTDSQKASVEAYLNVVNRVLLTA